MTRTLGDAAADAGPDLAPLLEELTRLRAAMAAADAPSFAAAIHPHYRDGARNLLHYLALRRHDLRPLQSRLAALGLSSLGRAEPHALATVDAALHALRRLAGLDPGDAPPPSPDAFTLGPLRLAARSLELLGPPRPDRGTRIMVTAPTESADDPNLMRELLLAGMDCLRINCAHDGPEIWSRMIDRLRQAERDTGRRCPVAMDLAGPKLRTGRIVTPPAVIRVRPKRDAYGRVVAPARIRLIDRDAPFAAPSAADDEPDCGSHFPTPSDVDARFAVPGEFLAALHPGRSLTLSDARDALRVWTVVARDADGCLAEALRTAYLTPEVRLRLEADADGAAAPMETPIGELPADDAGIKLRTGDLLIVARHAQAERRLATAAEDGRIPAMIGCTLPAMFDDVRPGEPIWFDDGKIGGRIERVDADAAYVRIERARPGGDRLRSDKGINLPDSRLNLPALTPQDLIDLEFAVCNADVVQLSFANTPDDVQRLLERLAKHPERRPAVVLKIETRRGFENLASMLLTAMRWPNCGVMIARGDLAVECGFERLAEVQEEILWICEAAHVPVIWATQVLESLAKQGLPSRAEITDAAMSHRAECVMLNKGPHVCSAVRTLDDILRRMQSHQQKKRAMLRELKLASRTLG